MSTRISLVILAVLSIAAVPAQAALLDLTLLDSPDITSGFADVMYTAATDEFIASGWSLSMFDGNGDPVNIDPAGSFDIGATIDETGAPTGGALAITGQVLTFGPTLLTAELTAFGYLDGGGDLFEFLFTVTGGDLATTEFYGEPGTVVGVILDANGSDFSGSFNSDFNNNFGMPGFGMGVSDTAPIPEPSSLLLLLVGGVLAFRRRA